VGYEQAEPFDTFGRTGIGRNGAGNPHKGARAGSTLLKILSRITEPSAGRENIKRRMLAVGDAQFQKKCLGKMGNVAKDGRCCL
jgi:ABC-type polysaccharide/polyol phosphate transport system ATPase subunit